MLRLLRRPGRPILDDDTRSTDDDDDVQSNYQRTMAMGKRVTACADDKRPASIVGYPWIIDSDVVVVVVAWRYPGPCVVRSCISYPVVAVAVVVDCC